MREEVKATQDKVGLEIATDDTTWLCPCGNTPHSQGFHPWPREDSPWVYRCDRCGRLVDIETRDIIGSTKQNPVNPDVMEVTWFNYPYAQLRRAQV